MARITLRLDATFRPRNGHVAAMVGRKAGVHGKTTKAKRKADKEALRKTVSVPFDPSACGHAFRSEGPAPHRVQPMDP